MYSRVPGSMLQLLDSSRSDADGVESNLKAEAAARGVHPDRVKLDTILPRGEHVWVRRGSHVVILTDPFISMSISAGRHLESILSSLS